MANVSEAVVPTAVHTDSLLNASFPHLSSSLDPPSSATEWPSPVGLCLGLLSVAVGQVVVLLFQYLRLRFKFLHPKPIQPHSKSYDFWEGVATHLAQPEGFVVLTSYLSLTWMFNLMPASYYSFEGGVNWLHVLQQLLIQDVLQTLMHMLEHSFTKWCPKLYQLTHKPHHRFTNPRLFDAFNGSLGDTVCMILIPLYATANAVHCNVWSYMAFGTIYANYLTLIHSEYINPWDRAFHLLGIGTASDHHVHHAKFFFNYGHLFTYWDRLLGTYHAPSFQPQPASADGGSASTRAEKAVKAE